MTTPATESSTTLAQEVDDIIPYSHWAADLASLRHHYTKANPFPHSVFENFLNPAMLEKALEEFPSLDSGEWTYYVHYNEKKFGRTDLHAFGPTLQSVIREFNSLRFLRFLTALTGIENLIPDESLKGGGLHQSGPGGYLNIHADFTVHPYHRNWRRRINLLVYLNKDWRSSYRGQLELWDQKMKRCVHRIAPLFNRAVIFNTDANAFHGHPKPLRCPEGMTRKSLALYYFTQDDNAFVRSTEYKPRPREGWKGIPVYFDKMLLRCYDAVKRRLGFKDNFASRALKFIHHFQNRAQKE